MYKFIVLTLFTGLMAVSIREAGAACGGGGWHQSASQSKPAAAVTVQATDSKVYETRAEPIVNHVPAVESNRASSSFDSQFDGVNSQLSLNASQLRNIADAKGNVRNRIAKLEKKQARADEKLARCTGDCEDEARDVNKARAALNSYDAKAEFSKELKSILTSRQWDLYNSISVSSAK